MINRFSVWEVGGELWKLLQQGFLKGLYWKVYLSFQGLYFFLWRAYENMSLSPINTVPEKAWDLETVIREFLFSLITELSFAAPTE